MLFSLRFLFKRNRPCRSPVSIILPSPRAQVVSVANTKVPPDRSQANLPIINSMTSNFSPEHSPYNTINTES